MYNKLKLWFFRDLTDYQRRQLFSVFGMPVDEIGYSHGKQEVALRHAVRSLITAKPDTTPPAPLVTVPIDPTDAMIEAAIAADWECEGDEKAAAINVWHAMLAASEGTT